VQASSPVLGWITGLQFVSFIEDFDHWFAFVVLGFIGGHMIREFLKTPNLEQDSPDLGKLSLFTLIGMGIATSIDALAVGVTFAFLSINIWLAIAFIGGCTFIISFVGYYIGHKMGWESNGDSNNFGDEGGWVGFEKRKLERGLFDVGDSTFLLRV